VNTKLADQANYRNYLTVQMDQQKEQNRKSTEMTKEEKRFNKHEMKIYKSGSTGEHTNLMHDSVIAPKLP
jgi:zona occludens toxin (predicted ATPase)